MKQLKIWSIMMLMAMALPVMEAYGFPVKSSFTESQCVAELFKLYKEKTKNDNE